MDFAINSLHYATFRRELRIFRAESTPAEASVHLPKYQRRRKHLPLPLFPRHPFCYASAQVTKSINSLHTKRKFLAEKHQGFCHRIMPLNQKSQQWFEGEALASILPDTVATVNNGKTNRLMSAETHDAERTPKILTPTRKP